MKDRFLIIDIIFDPWSFVSSTINENFFSNPDTKYDAIEYGLIIILKSFR